jgi:hypothetical protein
MSVVTHVYEIPHHRSKSYVDEHVDQFSAFQITWNDAEAIHLTFGRNSLSVKTSRLEHYDDKPTESKTGEVEVFRLDVASVSMPIETAKDLVASLSRMISAAEARDNE